MLRLLVHPLPLESETDRSVHRQSGVLYHLHLCWLKLKLTLNAGTIFGKTVPRAISEQLRQSLQGNCQLEETDSIEAINNNNHARSLGEAWGGEG